MDVIVGVIGVIVGFAAVILPVAMMGDFLGGKSERERVERDALFQVRLAESIEEARQRGVENARATIAAIR